MTTTTPTTPGRAGSSKSSVRSLLPLSLLHLSRRARKAVLYLHILASVSWIGVDLVMGALVLRGLTTDDPTTLATVFTALEMFCVPLLLTLGLLLIVINALLLLLTEWISGLFGLGFTVDGFWTAVGGPIIISIASFVLNVLLPDGD